MVKKRHLVVATASAATFVLLLRRIQSLLLYHPRRYTWEDKKMKNEFTGALKAKNFVMSKVKYAQTEGGAKSENAFLISPKEPTRLWILYGGNAMLALDYSSFLVDVISSTDQSKNAFLLMDFPGYGNSSGSITPSNTLEESKEALKATEEHLNRSLEINGFGHSLGCAAILQLAATRPLNNVILSAPFLSIADMGVAIFPFLKVLPRYMLNILIRHNWDNAQALPLALSQQEAVSGGSFHIVHGKHDSIVPFDHGKQLAAKSPKIVFHPSISDHNDILTREVDLYARLLEGKQAKI